MKIIPSFNPAITYSQLNKIMARILFNNIPAQYIDAFENEFAKYLGVKHAIRVPSGRWGLYYILKSLDLQKGDEVILPAFTYFAVPAAVVKAGLNPLFADTNPRNLNIDVEEIAKNITSRTRVIIPTHLCGLVCNMTEIIDIAKKHNIRVIEDCAQSLGAEYKNRKVGSFGDASYFTFGITKNFTTLGGGMIATNNADLARSLQHHLKDLQPLDTKTLFLRSLKAYIIKSATSSFLFPAIYVTLKLFLYFGIDIVDCIFHEKELWLSNLPRTGQLNSIQAELGIAQLKRLDKNNEIRMEKGLELYRNLKEIANIHVPLLETDAKNIFSSCPIFVKHKNDMKRILLTKRVNVSGGYMQDCSGLNIFQEFKKYCPNAMKIKNEILYLPLYPELTASGIKHIIRSIREAERGISVETL